MIAGAAGSVAGVRHTAAVFAVLGTLFLLAGCGPTVVYFADPALSSLVGNHDDFEDSLRQAGRDLGERVVVEWDPSESVGTSWR